MRGCSAAVDGTEDARETVQGCETVRQMCLCVCVSQSVAKLIILLALWSVVDGSWRAAATDCVAPASAALPLEFLI